MTNSSWENNTGGHKASKSNRKSLGIKSSQREQKVIMEKK